MNYIELIRRFWQLHERYQFSVTEIALYFHLIEVCNRCGWTNPFKRNNARVCADLNMSFNTLKNARTHLSQVSLISFTSSAGSPNVTYTLTSSNFDEVSNEVGVEVLQEPSPPTPPKPPAKPRRASKPKEPIGSKVEYAEFVRMTKNEYQKLVNDYGEDGAKTLIKLLDDYKGSSGKKYKSDYRAILTWVVDKYLKINNGNGSKNTRSNNATPEPGVERNYDETF